MRIDSAGKVGIGTTSPAEELVVRADAPSIQLESSNASGRNYGFQASNDGKFHAYDGTTGVNRLTIDSNGNVGIGETSPTGTALQIRRSGAAGIVMKETGVAQFYVEQDTDAKIRWTNSNDLIFSGGANGTTEKARILNGGGLTFNGDTAAANALDDYEEGTWTPAIGSSGGSTPNYTTSVATADYVKIGKIVHASFLIVVTGVTDNGGSGNKIVTGLPFSQNQNAYQQVGVIGYNDVWGDAVDRMYITGSNLTIIPTGVTQSNYGGVITTGYFSGSITYSTDD